MCGVKELILVSCDHCLFGRRFSALLVIACFDVNKLLSVGEQGYWYVSLESGLQLCYQNINHITSVGIRIRFIVYY